MIGVPQVAAFAPIFFKLFARAVIEFALIAAKGFGVGGAERAHAVVTRKDCCAEVGRVGAQLPLMYAVRAAECEAALGNGGCAAAAGTASAIFGPATGLGASGGH